MLWGLQYSSFICQNLPHLNTDFLVNLKEYLESVNGILVSPSDPDEILQANPNGELVMVDESSLLDSLTPSWSHMTLLNMNRHCVENFHGA